MVEDFPLAIQTEEDLTSQSNNATRYKIKNSATIKKLQKKGSSSMADVIKRKLSLMKITGQKVPKNRVVNLAPSTARILMR